jgi:pyruvate,water dikinase
MAVDPVIPLDALRRDAIAAAGGKAANLGELCAAGFPVPPGFCVTTAAYAKATAQAGLAPFLDELAATDKADTAALAAIAGRARAAIGKAPLDEEVLSAVREAYRALGEQAAVAVRSSATAEDLPDASFAGQQDTYLNVVGEEALIAAIQRGFASLFNERAVVYRAKNRIDPRSVALAVVVERMVEAEAAGVLFTANPVTGRRREAVIDASVGLGEAVVSGAVNPDHFEVRASTMEIVARRLGDKKIAIEPVPGGGTRQVQRGEGGGSCLSDEDVRALVALGARVEAHYGAPQDIEWAIDRARTIWLLQARPITTLYPLPESASKTDAELSVYFNVNVAQGVFQPLTPMGLYCLRRFIGSVLKAAGSPPVDEDAGPSILTEAGHRLFVDITAIVRDPLGRKMAAFVLSRMEARSAAALSGLLDDPRLSPRPIGLPGFIAKTLARTRAPVSMAKAIRDPRAARARAQETEREALALGNVPEGAGPEARVSAADRLLGVGLGLGFHALIPVCASGFGCFWLARQALGDLCTAEEIQATLRGLPYNPTTEMDLALWALSRRVRDDAPSRHALTGVGPKELARRYRSGELPKVLQEGLADFLARYGARSVAEIDVGVARWSEDPTHLLGSLANYLALPEDRTPADAQFEKAAREAEAMVETLGRRAGGIRGSIVRSLLGRARALAGQREAPKFFGVRLLARVRALLIEVGEELARRGQLAAADDVFFLTLPEVRAALEGADPKPRVAARRSSFTRELARKHLPRILLSDGTDLDAIAARERAADAASGGSTLAGTPASAGKVTAKARVVLEPVGAALSPGEILVAPSTDPGWTPLFLTAAGLVMEMGGAMSHGAVVAREYGIAAVVGVAGATSRITTGQSITVDGAAGTVTLH